MPTYTYSCAVCGDFDLVRCMADAGTAGTCPGCGRAGRRRYGAPALRRLDPVLRGALDSQSRSADAPQVVTSVPARTGADRRRVMRSATDHRQARLPRP